MGFLTQNPWAPSRGQGFRVQLEFGGWYLLGMGGLWRVWPGTSTYVPCHHHLFDVQCSTQREILVPPKKASSLVCRLMAYAQLVKQPPSIHPAGFLLISSASSEVLGPPYRNASLTIQPELAPALPNARLTQHHTLPPTTVFILHFRDPQRDSALVHASLRSRVI